MSELALKLIAEAKEKRLISLDLGNCGLTELPDELFELEWLEELNLGVFFYDFRLQQYRYSKNKETRNSITYISPKIKNLGNLKFLGLAGNEFIDFSFLKSLTNLTFLDWSQNVSSSYAL